MARTRFKDILTTGKVAKICKVSPATVAKWFDSGNLRGYRIPGSKERRIPYNQLVRFMRAHGISLDSLPVNNAILIFDQDCPFYDCLRRGYKLMFTANPVEAGMLMERFKPALVILNTDREAPLREFVSLRGSDFAADFKIIAVGADISIPEVRKLKVDSFQVDGVCNFFGNRTTEKESKGLEEMVMNLLS